MPIGRGNASGSASFANGVFTLEARDGEFGAENDVYRFVQRAMSGDGTIVARLDGLKGAGESTAGVLICENVRGGRVRLAFLGAMGDGNLVFSRRHQTWAPQQSLVEKTPLPQWLKLSRQGKLVKAWHSADGKTWQTLGERELELPRDCYVGVMAAGKEATRATFSEVSFTKETTPAANPGEGVLLRGGTFIAGGVYAADATTIRMGRGGRDVILPVSRVARIHFRRLTSEILAKIPPGRTGAALANGDFFDGTVEGLIQGQVKINSVLFGARRLNPWDQIAAAVYHDVGTASGKFEVRTVDGSVFKARSLAVEGNTLKIVDEAEGTFVVNYEEIVQICGL